MSLGLRLALVILTLALESLPLSLLVEGSIGDVRGAVSEFVHVAEHWGLRFFIAYVVAVLLLVSLGRTGTLLSIGSRYAREPVRFRFLFWHAVSLITLAALSNVLFAGQSTLEFLGVIAAWHVAAVLTAAFLMATLAPLTVWRAALGRSRVTLIYALAPALGAVLVIHASQLLWHPAAGVTFQLTEAVLRRVLPDLHVDYSALTLGTSRFSVQIADPCSGLEGIGLMLVFCTSWLWLFRREYYLPRALSIIPLAVILVFLLNSLRIVAIVLIGDGGYPKVAIAGFHSQAGWMAFNAVALGVALAAKRSRWLNRTAMSVAPATSEWSPEATYLLPLLAILACGMVAHALSAGFEFLYPLRFLGALVVLWLARRQYATMKWRPGWRALVVGVGVFAIWMLFSRWLEPPHGAPTELAELPDNGRIGWIFVRAVASITTVPIAEELAFRGFLMRRFTNKEFESVDFRKVGLPALVLSSIAFGATHGVMWMPGAIAGFAYGWLATSSNRIGEAAAAHAVTNGLILIAVLAFGQWQLW